jgi:HdeA/HdeB family protein
MTMRGKTVLYASALLSGLVASSAVFAEPQPRTIEQYLCKDVIRESGDNRDVAIAFLHGYLLGKSGSSKFDLEALHKQTDDFIEQCLDNPAQKAVDVMAKVKG